MPSSYNRATGAIDAFTTGTLTGVVAGADHGNKADAINKVQAQVVKEAPLNVRWPEFGLVVDGTTDNTAGFNAARDAAGAGGEIYIPPGIYRLDSFAPLDRQIIRGAGFGTQLKAKTSATQVVLMSGNLSVRLVGLTIDGNSKASMGLTITGSATESSQNNYVEHCSVFNCTTGINVAQGTVSQADKNTFVACHVYQCDWGMRINSVNAQEQVLINCTFDNQTNAGIRASEGTLQMIGGQFQGNVGTNRGIEIDGAMQWIHLDGVIFEGPSTDIWGNGAWPIVPLHMHHCVCQGTTNTVKASTTSGVLIAEGCLFHNGDLDLTATDFAYEDRYNTYFSGVDVIGGTGFRRFKNDINGLNLSSNANATAFAVSQGKIQLGPDAGLGAMKGVFPYSQAIDLGSQGANSTTEVNAAAATIALAVGDLPMLIGAPGLNHGLEVVGLPVTTANNLRLRVSNHTAGAIDAGSLTFSFLVVKF